VNQPASSSESLKALRFLQQPFLCLPLFQINLFQARKSARNGFELLPEGIDCGEKLSTRRVPRLDLARRKVTWRNNGVASLFKVVRFSCDRLNVPVNR
jgi:hypothetical protein